MDFAVKQRMNSYVWMTTHKIDDAIRSSKTFKDKEWHLQHWRVSGHLLSLPEIKKIKRQKEGSCDKPRLHRLENIPNLFNQEDQSKSRRKNIFKVIKRSKLHLLPNPADAQFQTAKILMNLMLTKTKKICWKSGKKSRTLKTTAEKSF
jgi:hypothetical protein